jgi:CheY-like chemotaxis protein
LVQGTISPRTFAPSGPAAASGEASTAARRGLRTASHRALRILVVDDEPMVAATLADIVVENGGEVVGVISLGLASVGAASVIRPDVVLMDVRLLPGLDGIDAAAIIRERRWTPIVFISAVDVREEIPRRLVSLEGVEVLSKPIDERALCEAILRAWSARRPE